MLQPPPDNPLFIGVDIGTSGCRAVAIDDNKTIIGSASTSFPPGEPAPPCSEQDPHQWWTAFESVIKTLLTAEDRLRVQAMAIDGTSGSVLLTDSDGEPLEPALMYNDARAQTEACDIAAVAPKDSAAHGTGSGLAKLLWLQAHAPDAARAAYVMHPSDWITAKLTGRYGISDENNCLKLGYDPVKRKWPAWLDQLNVRRELLPDVVIPGAPTGTLTPSISKKLGLPADVMVVAGTTDSIAGCLAAGIVQPGEAITSLGSTLVLKIVADKPVFAPDYGVYSHRLGDHWLVGGASNSGGAVLLDYFSVDELDAMTARLQPDIPTGLDYYPLRSSGERFPITDPEWTPRLSPRPDDDVIFFQGILEGIARVEAQGYKRLVELGVPKPTVIKTTGTGARNAGWTQIREQMLGIPVQKAEHEEAAFGAALLALRTF